MKCLLCGIDKKLTREHILPRALLEKFNDVENSDPRGALRSIEPDGYDEFSNIRKARSLKPKKNLCSDCNSSRSTKCDNEFTDFVWSLFLWGKSNETLNKLYFPTSDEIKAEMNNVIQRINVEDRPSFPVEGLIVQSILNCSEYLKVLIVEKWDVKLIRQYLCKHTSCYLSRKGYDIPEYLKIEFLNNSLESPLSFEPYLLSNQFKFGYQNVGFKEYKDRLEYEIIFSNVFIKIRIPKLEIVA